MSNTDVDTIVKTLIQTQIIQALKTSDDAIDIMVQAALSKPVDESTGSPDRGYGKKIPFLEYLVGDCIRDATIHAVRKVLAESSDQIEASVRTGLNADSVVAAITKSLVKSVNEDWRINVSFEAEKSSR